MNRLFVILFCFLFPILASAQDSMTFAPPPTDYSVIFLSNIFGIVDGVLYGTGSQILGTMFSIFNSAILAIGGLLLTYTLAVSTINTAHEGQMLGQKWSSVWVPVRSVLGLSLLIPKASGYCLAQIFMMWVVVQGAGAADKVWEAALGYLNRGGVIVQSQTNPMKLMSGPDQSVAKGAYKILTNQVCMYGVERVLRLTREDFLKQKEKKTGPCWNPANEDLQKFCNTPVPDFLGNVNMVKNQNDHPTQNTFSEPTPNFLGDESIYSRLNGMCGHIDWNALTAADLKGILDDMGSNFTKDQADTIKLSRAIAIQDMYQNITTIAKVIVDSNPQINPKSNSNTSYPPYTTSTQPYGIPYLNSGTPCTNGDVNCTGWGPDDSSASAATLFNGTEFQGALAIYQSNMKPTLNLIKASRNKDESNNARKFIKDANEQGWLMAGSYFFDLAKLNAYKPEDVDVTDTKTGLDNSVSDLSLGLAENKTCQGSLLCLWMGKYYPLLSQVENIVNGSMTKIVEEPPFTGKEPNLGDHPPVREPGASTVNGFVNNSMMVNLPGQPGVGPPVKFAMKINTDVKIQKLKTQEFHCTWYALWLDCLFGNIFYNGIVVTFYNLFLLAIVKIINSFAMTIIAVPLLGMSQIFVYGVSMLQQPTVNPIVALANMGVNYINFSAEVWIYMIMAAVTTILLPFGWFVLPFLIMAMPMILAWVGTMVSVGFITAYYIPFLPYMLFTFGAIAWFMSVIEAMVAAPIVAFGIAHPEGEGLFGKGEQAIMIALNVFLRPAMMIIGYIAAISLSYVGVWLINAGFQHAALFVTGDPSQSGTNPGNANPWEGGTDCYANQAMHDAGIEKGDHPCDQASIDEAGKMDFVHGYPGWAGIYGFFFSILIYTSMYLMIVQKAFSLITHLPDKVLRWIGGQPESTGQEAAQWSEEGKGKVEKAEGGTMKAGGQRDKQLQGGVMRKVSGKGGGAKYKADSNQSTDPDEQ
jgi:defect-in-organelle-trafficking protein DotA